MGRERLKRITLASLAWVGLGACSGKNEPYEPPAEPDDSGWTAVSAPLLTCRDGSTAQALYQEHKKGADLLIFFEGGGACFNAATCAQNPANFDAAAVELFKEGLGGGGVFDRSKGAENPFAEYNFLFVPYCSGDVWLGAQPNGVVPGVPGVQKFLGYANSKAALDYAAASLLPAAGGHVVLAGESAGGFGVLGNYFQFNQAFAGKDVKLHVIDDSGPAMSAPYLAACLQAQWRQLWNFTDTFLAACGAGCQGLPNPDDYFIAFIIAALNAYPTTNYAIIESDLDNIIRYFYGFGNFDCGPCPYPAMDQRCFLDPTAFAEGLLFAQFAITPKLPPATAAFQFEAFVWNAAGPPMATTPGTEHDANHTVIGGSAFYWQTVMAEAATGEVMGMTVNMPQNLQTPSEWTKLFLAGTGGMVTPIPL